jgi:hypothetical protein
MNKNRVVNKIFNNKLKGIRKIGRLRSSSLENILENTNREKWETEGKEQNIMGICP